ncbi:MAG: hypothetical protein M1321_02560 [Candidatus Marsarchaeota archaeon]|nr:hypothetical protein [Candidatus Marsarchaeota archaeon]
MTSPPSSQPKGRLPKPVAALRRALHGDERLLLYAVMAMALAVVAVIVAFTSGSVKGQGLSRCTGITLSTYRDQCLSQLAYSTANVSVCTYMSDEQSSDACILNVSAETSNALSCTGMSNRYYRDLCVYDIANATGSYSLCGTLDDASAVQCYSAIASKLHNPGICSGINDNASAMSICSSAAEMSYAFATSNASACALVSNSTYAPAIYNITAYAELAFPRSNSSYASTRSIESPLSYVQLLPNVSYSARDLCYMYMAYNLSDSAYCGHVSNETLSKTCIETVPGAANSLVSNSIIAALNSTNTTLILPRLKSILCTNSSFSGSQCEDIVLMWEAMQTKNASICANLPGYENSTCYASLAANYRNASYCSYIKNATLNVACLNNIYNAS